MSVSRAFSNYGIVLALGLGISLSALADPHGDRHDRDDHHWRGGDIRHFHERDFPRWREGHWYHGPHDDRFGWWWIVAGMWYFYPAAVYPYPDPYVPSPVIIEQAPAESAPTTAVPPPAQSWYYCTSARAYYPYVAHCPEGWKQVPAQPSDAPAQ